MVVVWVVVAEEVVGEEGRVVVVVAGLCRAGSQGVEELEAVPGEGVVSGPQVVAGEGGGERRQEEQERGGGVAQAGLRGCGRRHGGCVGGAGQEAVERSVVVVRVGAVLGAVWWWRLYVVGGLWVPGFLVVSSFRVWFSVWCGGCGGVGEVRWWGVRAWGGRWRCLAGAAFSLGGFGVVLALVFPWGT